MTRYLIKYSDGSSGYFQADIFADQVKTDHGLVIFLTQDKVVAVYNRPMSVTAV